MRRRHLKRFSVLLLIAISITFFQNCSGFTSLQSVDTSTSLSRLDGNQTPSGTQSPTLDPIVGDMTSAPNPNTGTNPGVNPNPSQTSPLTIAFVGDSITAASHDRFARLFPGANVHNFGVYGDRTYELLSPVRGSNINPPKQASLETLFSLRPDVLIIMIGINDLKNSLIKEMNNLNLPGSSWEQLESFASRIKAQGRPIRVVFQSVLPVYELLHFRDMNQVIATEPMLSRAKNSEIIAYNQRLQQYCQKHGFEYLDLWNTFTGSGGAYIDNFTGDGLHLAEEGYRRWETALVRYFQTTGLPPPPATNSPFVFPPEPRGPGLSAGPFVYLNRVFFSSGTGYYCEYMTRPSLDGIRVVNPFPVEMEADGYCER